jgi:hypothetical protein
LIGRLRQQLAEKEQDFQVVKLAVIETEGRCAEFKAMLDDTLKQEFAVRQQLAEARAEVERQKQCVERREEMRRAVVDELGELRATLDACTVADTLERMAGEEHESRLRQWLAAEQSKRQLLENQLAAQAAELERLRERCEAAEKAVAFFFECQIAIQLPGGNADETFGFETLRDGRFAVTKWVDARQFVHIRDTPMEAFQDAITDNWLPDSNNKGGE